MRKTAFFLCLGFALLLPAGAGWTKQEIEVTFKEWVEPHSGETVTQEEVDKILPKAKLLLKKVLNLYWPKATGRDCEIHIHRWGDEGFWVHAFFMKSPYTLKTDCGGIIYLDYFKFFFNENFSLEKSDNKNGGYWVSSYSRLPLFEEKKYFKKVTRICGDYFDNIKDTENSVSSFKIMGIYEMFDNLDLWRVEVEPEYVNLICLGGPCRTYFYVNRETMEIIHVD